MKRVLCIRLPNWPVQRLVIAQPVLRGKVIILHRRHPRRGQCVVACSRVAYCCGVRIGMSLTDAMSIQQQAIQQQAITLSTTNQHTGVHSHAAAHVVLHDSQADWVILQQLAQWCEQFSPIVGFDSNHSQLARESVSKPKRYGFEADHFQRSGEGSVGDAYARERGFSECLYLDATDMGSYFNGELCLVRQVADAFDRRGYYVRVVLADTIGAAWGLAYFATSQHPFMQVSGTSSLAETGDMQSSDIQRGGQGTTNQRSSFGVVPTELTYAALESLPIQALRLSSRTVALLRQLGISQIGQLARLPRSSLSARFGDLLLERWDQAMGRVEEVFIAHRPTPVFQEEWCLEYPTKRIEAIRTIVEQLIERVTKRLARRGEGVIEFVCRLDCQTIDSSASEDYEQNCSPRSTPAPISFRVGLFQPTISVKHLNELLALQFEQLRSLGMVERIVVEVLSAASLEGRQRELFPDRARHTSRQLARLVDRLSSRLGRDGVVRPQLQGESQPEWAYRYHSLTGCQAASNGRSSGQRVRKARKAAAVADLPAQNSSRARKARKNRRDASPAANRPALAGPLIEASRHQPLVRPIHLYTPPVPLEVVAVVPDGPPIRFGVRNGSDHDASHSIARYWGPERIETGWWRGRSIRRDYYRVEMERGDWFWLFRQVDDGKWFLHGVFG